MTYIATFYSHFGAIRFKKNCEKLGIEATAMPVPRNLSSSCGTCVKFIYERNQPVQIIFNDHRDEIEQVVEILDNDYKCIYKAEDS